MTIHLECADELLTTTRAVRKRLDLTRPVPREVKFCDVVHFVVVSEFLASHGNSRWIHSNVGREVASEIPDNL